MILLRTYAKSSNELIYGRHEMPFDPMYGFKNIDGSIMTEEQVEQFGVLVEPESIPVPNTPEGNQALLHINCDTREMWYTYEAIPESPKTAEQLRLEALELENILLKEKLTTTQEAVDFILLNMV